MKKIIFAFICTIPLVVYLFYFNKTQIALDINLGNDLNNSNLKVAIGKYKYNDFNLYRSGEYPLTINVYNKILSLQTNLNLVFGKVNNIVIKSPTINLILFNNTNYIKFSEILDTDNKIVHPVKDEGDVKYYNLFLQSYMVKSHSYDETIKTDYILYKDIKKSVIANEKVNYVFLASNYDIKDIYNIDNENIFRYSDKLNMYDYDGIYLTNWSNAGKYNFNLNKSSLLNILYINNTEFVASTAISEDTFIKPKEKIIIEEFKITKKIKPKKPFILFNKPDSNKVILELALDRVGKIKNLSVLESPHQKYSKAALEAVKGWIFEPKKINNQPTNSIEKIIIFID